jgi:hypothetical protein
MRFISLAGALALLLAGAAVAQDSSGPAGPTFSADRFKAHVAFLADDRLEGRDTGSRGYEIGAAYVASQFMALGLQPGGDDGGWYKQVPLRSAVLAGTPVMTLTGPGGPRSFENGGAILVRPSLIAEEVELDAPVVFAGYGLDAPDQGTDDYKGLDVRGKVVVVLAGVPSDIPSEIGAYLGDRKAAMAAKHGAVALVQINTDASARVQRWAAMRPYAGRPSMGWLDPGGKPLDEAPGVRARVLVDDPVAASLCPPERLRARHPARPADVEPLDPDLQPRGDRPSAGQRSGASRRICRADGPSRPSRDEAGGGCRRGPYL